MKRWVSVLAMGLMVAGLGGCGTRKRYPEPLPGWHDADYSVIFGRVQRVVATNASEPPVWVVRWGLAQDKYGGEFALTPQQKLLGYSGGEKVEIHGRIRTDLGYPSYAGTWYEVKSIQMWKGRD